MVYGNYFLERSLPSKDIKLYHGSCVGNYEKILANSPNNGKRWEKIGLSSFWFIKKEYATLFATAELIQKETDKKVYILIDNDMKALVPEEYRFEVEKILRHNDSYVYIKTVNGKYINGGQGRNFPEYTLNFDVIPDEIYTNTYNDMIKCVKFVSNEYINSIIEKYKKNSMTYDNNLIGQLIDAIMYDTHQNVVKAKKVIKSYNEV